MDLTLIDRALGQGIPYITYAVPLFFILIGVEAVAGFITNRQVYRLNDSVNDLSCGVLQQIVGIFMKTGFFAGYVWLYERFALVDIGNFSTTGKWVAAILLFLAVDLAYYWFHRIAHVVNAPWATHIVHHQSEEYNLAVALRQGTFQDVFSWVFYAPLMIVGFPPLWLVAMKAFDTLYQFWIHTRLIGKLGPLEYVLNTPSHHRVHHARNPKYLDKNYAGTLIIWDRMFGTFIEEQEEPVYGLTKPLCSWNPVWANFHLWVEMGRDAWLAPKWTDKIKIWFMTPGWRPDGLEPNPHGPQVTPETVIKYDTHVPPVLSVYVCLHFVLSLVVAVMALAGGDQLTAVTLIALAVWVVASLLNFGAVYERRRWAMFVEIARLTLGLTGLIVWMAGSNVVSQSVALAVIAAGSVLTAASLAVLRALRSEFTGEVAYRDGRAPGVISTEQAQQTLAPAGPEEPRASQGVPLGTAGD